MMYRGLIAGLFLSLFPILAAGTTFNIVGDDDFPPFSFIDQNQQASGIDIEILQELSKRMGIKINIELVPWKRLLQTTKNGTILGSFSLFKTPERESFSLFTHPLHYSTFKLFTAKNNIIKFENIHDLYGKRIGIEAGFVISNEFDEASRQGYINLVEIFNFDDAFRRLVKGGIDAFVGNDLVIKYKLKNEYNENKSISTIVSLPKPLKKSRGAFLVLSKKFPLEDKLKWQAKITETLKSMEKEGVSLNIIKKYMQ